MAKIYGTPIMAGGAGGANKDLPPLLDNFKAKSTGTVPLPLDDEGTVEFSTLPSGTKVRMTPNNPYYAVVTHSRTDNDDVAIVYDTKEMGLPKMRNEDEEFVGASGSDIFQWMNATSDSDWWSEVGVNRTEPSYSNEPGFLNVIGLSLDSVVKKNFELQRIPPQYDTYDVFASCFTAYMDYDFFDEKMNFEETGRDYLAVADVDGGCSTYNGRGSSEVSVYAPTPGTGYIANTLETYAHIVLKPKPTTKVKQNGDEYYFFEEAESVELSADKMLESRANELAGAVWVYGNHSPANVNDGTKIHLTREEIVTNSISLMSSEDSQLISSLPSGSKVKLGVWDGTPLQWKLGRDSVTQEVRLVLEPISVTSIGQIMYDNAEPSNTDMDRRTGGNNRYIWSNVHQWLNSNKPANEWYVAQHPYDTAPDYAITRSGFLSEWEQKDLDAIENASWTTTKSTIDGGGTEVFNSKIAIISTSELGLESGTGGNKLDIFNGAGDINISAVYRTRNPYATNSRSVKVVSASGTLSDDTYAKYNNYLRAICAPNPSQYVSLDVDEDGCYTIVANVAESVSRSIPWSKTKDFYARQFTYNSKKQYQTMLEGAIATITLVGVPAPVSELAETHSGSSITLTWKNPTSDEFYDHTVVVYKTDAFPTAIDDGTQGYSGTDETATLSELELGSTYYISVFTVSADGLYGEPQTVQVEIPAGQLLSLLASGTKVKLGKWNNTDLQWKVARDTTDQSLRLVLEPTSVTLLGNMQWDAPEPSNSDSNRRSYGNNRYIYSNIHQWLNATKASGWYTAQHSADAAPAYSSSPGFLSGWSENHIAALDRATLTTSRTSIDGGGTETFIARVALISTTELGLQSNTGGGRLDIFNSDGDRATGSNYWTRTPTPSLSSFAYLVTGAGGLGSYSDVYNANGVRPLCIPVSTVLVSLEMDDDNCYVVQ